MYSLFPETLLEQFADNNSAAWMKTDGTLDEEKVKEFLEQMGRIYQAGKDAYPQAFDDSQTPKYERSYGIAWENVAAFSGTSLFALGGVFSSYDFAFVTSFADLL